MLKFFRKKSDKQLEPYLIKLLEWLQDINWPGALIILNRLKCYKGKALKPCLEYVINKTTNNENDLMWLDYLSELLDNRDLISSLSRRHLSVLKSRYHNR